MHKIVGTVYGFVDKPPLLPDISAELERMSQTDSAEKYTLDRAVNEIAQFRKLQLAKHRLLGSTILK